jgi:hypothetical protein
VRRGTQHVAQPFWLHWRTPAGKVRRHSPGFFARLAGGGGLVIDSRPEGVADDGDREAFAVTARACEVLGEDYAVCGEMDPVVAANHRWLARYGYPRCGDLAAEARLLDVFGSGLPLMEGAGEAGDPIATLPPLFHLMWRRELLADSGEGCRFLKCRHRSSSPSRDRMKRWMASLAWS